MFAFFGKTITYHHHSVVDITHFAVSYDSIECMYIWFNAAVGLLCTNPNLRIIVRCTAKYDVSWLMANWLLRYCIKNSGVLEC